MLSKPTQAMFWFILSYLVLQGILFVGFSFGGQYIAELFSGFSGTGKLVLFFLLQEILLVGLLSWVRYKTTDQGWKEQLDLVRQRRQRKGRGYVGTYVCGGLAIYFVGSGLLLGILTLAGRDIPGLYGDQMVMGLLEGIAMTQWREYVLIGLLVAVMGPIVEEIIFRGAMTHSFMTDWGRKGVVLASLVFAAIHGERAVVRNLVILSMFLGYIYWKTGSMWYSFLFHLGINGLAITVLLISKMYPELLMG